MNKWYSAHIVMYVEIKEGEQKAFPVWENIVLIEGGSEEEAFRKAEKKGQAGEGDDGGTFRWAGRKATWVFGGVRKLTLCENVHEKPGDGTEVTYIELRVRSKGALNKLIRSEKVGVELRDGFPEEEEGRVVWLSEDRHSLRLLETEQQAFQYIQSYAPQIERAVVLSNALLIFSANGRPQQEREAGMVLHRADGEIRFLSRNVAELLLNEDLLRRLKIRIELPR